MSEDAPDLLCKAIRPRISASSLASTLGVTQQTISNWATRRSRPSFAHMVQLERLLGIPLSSWDDAPAAEAAE